MHRHMRKSRRTTEAEYAEEVQDYVNRALNVLGDDAQFRRENPTCTVYEYAADLVERDMDWAAITEQRGWLRFLEAVKRRLDRRKEELSYIPEPNFLEEEE